LLRAEVYEEYLAKVAGADYYVTRYRKKVLGESLTTVTRRQAYRLIRSSAAQALPPSFFRRMQIPVRGHDSELLAYESDVQDAGVTRDCATVRVTWAENVQGVDMRVMSESNESKYPTLLTFQNEQGHAESIYVWRGSVLGELQRLVSSLIKQFPWSEAQATWFVLTGEPPAVPPVKIRYTLRPVKVQFQPYGDTRRVEYGMVTISAAPWVSEKIVSEAYYNVQERILRNQHNRQLKSHTLELLRFVLSREDPTTLTRARRKQRGKELVEAWNRKYPHWGYQKSTSDFWRDYSRAERLVTLPKWASPRTLRHGE
jgi:hypothetical protein